MEILVIDDERLSRRTAAHTLEQAGYNVTMAEDGLEGLEILKEGRHRLVISDWKMPRMNGLELCRAIRSRDFSSYIYFIMLTGQTRPEDTLEGLSAGADDYVIKPFNPAELILRVNIGRRIIGLETRDMAIFAMAKLAESRDPETGAHLDRVRSYCRLLAQQLQTNPKHAEEINDEFVDLIYHTSPLHDIGKVAIPDCVLLKPGRFTDREFEIMKTHALHGSKTLEAAMEEFPNTPFLEMARDIALGHHEKFDGSGYPDGLVGDEIPLSARIMALADVYDALTSRRVYKDAYAHDVARTMITNDVGTHFDPDVVDAFLAVEQQFINIREQFIDKEVEVSV